MKHDGLQALSTIAVIVHGTQVDPLAWVPHTAPYVHLERLRLEVIQDPHGLIAGKSTSCPTQRAKRTFRGFSFNDPFAIERLWGLGFRFGAPDLGFGLESPRALGQKGKYSFADSSPTQRLPKHS